MTISNEAVEAAHAAICDQNLDDCLEWRGRCVKAVEAAAPIIRADVAEEWAGDMEGVIACGDVAEVAAFCPGETGRSEAVAARDSLYEEPADWLRVRAVAERGGQ